MFSRCIIFGAFLLIILLHEALQRYTAGKGGFQDHRCPVAHITSLWKNKEVWKNLSSQGRKFLKKIICSRGKGCVSDAALVAMLFPWEKSPLTLGQWPRTGPAGGQRAQLPAPACSSWILCCCCAGDTLVWGMLLSRCAERGGFPCRDLWMTLKTGRCDVGK